MSYAAAGGGGGGRSSLFFAIGNDSTSASFCPIAVVAPCIYSFVFPVNLNPTPVDHITNDVYDD